MRIRIRKAKAKGERIITQRRKLTKLQYIGRTTRKYYYRVQGFIVGGVFCGVLAWMLGTQEGWVQAGLKKDEQYYLMSHGEYAQYVEDTLQCKTKEGN